MSYWMKLTLFPSSCVWSWCFLTALTKTTWEEPSTVPTLPDYGIDLGMVWGSDLACVRGHRGDMAASMGAHGYQHNQQR